MIYVQQTVEKFKQVIPETIDGKKVETKKAMGKGHLSIESAEFSGKKVYLVVFRNMIGKTLFQGQINFKFSKMRRIEEKASKHQLKIALFQKIDPATKKPKVDYLVISFSRSDELKVFEGHFNEAMEELKKNAPVAATTGAKKEEEKKSE